MPPRVCSAAKACRFACSRSRPRSGHPRWLTRARSSPATICGRRSGTTARSSTSSAASTSASRRSDRRWAIPPIRRVSSRPCPGAATDSSRPSAASLVQSPHCRRARARRQSWRSSSPARSANRRRCHNRRARRARARYRRARRRRLAGGLRRSAAPRRRRAVRQRDRHGGFRPDRPGRGRCDGGAAGDARAGRGPQRHRQRRGAVSARAFRDLQRIGSELDADYIVLAQMKRDAAGVRLIVHLIRVERSGPRLGETYDRPAFTLDVPRPRSPNRLPAQSPGRWRRSPSHRA